MALALTVSACGTGDGSASADAAPSKAAFIKTADAICVKADAAQTKALAHFKKVNSLASKNTRWSEQAVVRAGLPAIRVEAEELGTLTPPSGDEAAIEAIVKGIEEGVKKSQAKPILLLQTNSAGPFTATVKAAEKYGFKACARPL